MLPQYKTRPGARASEEAEAWRVLLDRTAALSSLLVLRIGRQLAYFLQISKQFLLRERPTNAAGFPFLDGFAVHGKVTRIRRQVGEG